jgi:hypothetical protein
MKNMYYYSIASGEGPLDHESITIAHSKSLSMKKFHDIVLSVHQSIKGTITKERVINILCKEHGFKKIKSKYEMNIDRPETFVDGHEEQIASRKYYFQHHQNLLMVPFYGDPFVFVNNFYESEDEFGFIEAVSTIKQLIGELGGIPVFEAKPNGDLVEYPFTGGQVYYKILTALPALGDDMIKEATFLVRKMIIDRITKSKESGDNET